MTEREQRARRFATTCHQGQKRKYTNEPYIVHPANVVELVRRVPHNEDMLVAAWLHDTVEDCGISLEEIEEYFGFKPARLVYAITDVSKPKDGDRAARKAKDRRHIALASPDAQTIKLADLIDNTRSIVERDPKFAKIYLAEKRLLLEVLKAGGPYLWTMANDLAKGD